MVERQLVGRATPPGPPLARREPPKPLRRRPPESAGADDRTIRRPDNLCYLPVVMTRK
jgi:hypothetical protein